MSFKEFCLIFIKNQALRMDILVVTCAIRLCLERMLA